MAQVPDSDGVASVAPQTSAPEDYQRLDAPADAFGAGIAKGVQQFGSGATQAGRFWGQIQTDTSMNDANGDATQIVEKYKNLRGQDALNAQAETEAALQKAYKSRRDQLSTPEQQLNFDNGTRGFYQRFLQPQVYNHANQQAFDFAKNGNEASAKQYLDVLAANADDPDKAQVAIDGVLTAATKNAHLIYGDSATDDQVHEYVRPYLQTALKTQAQSISVNDPEGAVKFLDEHKDVIGIDYPSLSSQFRARATQQQSLGIVNDAMSSTAHNLQNATTVQGNTAAVREAIFQQESGNRDGTPKSANGAVGPGQVIPATFAQYAKPGEDINNPTDNRVVAARIVDDLSQKYDGDPSRIAVGYFSGPGNVAPAGSPTPWIKDVSDANGKSVSAYVQDVTQRLGSQGPMLAARASVYDVVLAKTEGNPQLRDAALREVGQRYKDAEIADLADQKARKAATDASLRNWGDEIRGGKSDMGWRRDPNLTEEQVEHLDKLALDTAKETLDGKPGDFGPKYADVQSRIFSTGPGRIVNQEQLLALAADGSLNPAGYKAASDKLAEVNRPGAEADRLLSSNFYAAARHQVTLEYEGGHDVIPGSGEKWNQALPALNQAISEGRAKGLTNQQLMDPANKDSVWPVLKPWLPTPAQAMTAEITKDDGATKQAVDWQKIDKLEDAVGAYQRHEITREQAKTLWDKNGWGKPASGPQVPQTDQTYSGPDVHDLAAPPGSANTDASQWDKRADGSQKGNGFLGLLRRPDGGVSSEISVGVSLGGKEVEIPLMVPTLTRDEVQTLLKSDPKSDDFWKDLPQPIKDKAFAFAQKRIAAGKSPFAGPDESPQWSSPSRQAAQ